MTDILQKLHLAAILFAASFVVSACGKPSDTENCEDPKKTAAYSKAVGSSSQAKTPAPIRMDPKDAMWCKSCVVGPHGYMSCQIVRQSDTAETVQSLKDRARIAACEDSGFTKDNCPSPNVISVSCKGDPPPADKTAAGKAMLDALKGSGPVVLTKDGKTVPNIMYQKKDGPGTPTSADVAKDKSSSASAPASKAPHIE